jgi:hypothetical protein
MGPISLSVTEYNAGKACQDKHSSLFGPLVSNTENGVL